MTYRISCKKCGHSDVVVGDPMKYKVTCHTCKIYKHPIKENDEYFSYYATAVGIHPRELFKH